MFSSNPILGPHLFLALSHARDNLIEREELPVMGSGQLQGTKRDACHWKCNVWHPIDYRHLHHVLQQTEQQSGESAGACTMISLFDPVRRRCCTVLLHGARHVVHGHVIQVRGDLQHGSIGYQVWQYCSKQSEQNTLKLGFLIIQMDSHLSQMY